jgi:hypothetical protein
MASQSFAEQMNLSTTLVNTLKEHLTGMPHLAPLHQELEAVITEGRALEDLKGLHTAQLRDTNAQRRELEKRGRELRLRLASALRAAFGPDNLKLLEFGVKPRAVVRRRRATKPEGPTLEDRTTTTQ